MFLNLNHTLFHQKKNHLILPALLKLSTLKMNSTMKNRRNLLEEFDTSESCNGINFWNALPDEFMEKILLCAIEESGYTTSVHKCQTYQSILKTCKRFQIIENRGKLLLPRIYINPIEFLLEAAYKGKIKVSVRKITSAFGHRAVLPCKSPTLSGENGICLVDTIATKALLVYHWSSLLER